MLTWEEARALATVNISITLIVKARDVSFTRVITSLVMDGRIRFTTCGKIMRKKGLIFCVS